MGHIYEDHGRVCVEGRREGFIVHASYGLKPLECKLSDVKPGDHFRDVDRETVYQVFAQLAGKTSVEPVGKPELRGDRPNDVVVVPTTGAPHYAPVDSMNDDDDPLGRLWRDFPHPEFASDDLDDLILALADYRNKLAD